MKKISFTALSFLLLTTSIVQTGCFASFQLTRKMWEFHDGIAGDGLGGRFIKTILYWFPGGIVYGIGGFVDLIIFNTIEFWTGSNPIAMNEGDIEIQKIYKNGLEYEIAATKNRFDIKQLTGENAGEKASLVFNVEDMSWVANTETHSIKVAQYFVDEKTNEVSVKIIRGSKKPIIVPFTEEGLAQLETIKMEDNLASK